MGLCNLLVYLNLCVLEANLPPLLSQTRASLRYSPLMRLGASI